MKRFNKYISLALVACAGAGFATSCDDAKDNDFVNKYDGPAGIYFSNTVSAYLELSEDQSTITYPVFRDEAGEELTVEVSVVPVSNYAAKIYTFPSSVTFAAGSKVADFVIGYDISKAEIGAEQQYTLTLDAESTPFASNSVIITLVNPIPWNLIGTNGQYYDYFWGVDTDENEGPVTVSVWQEEINKNHYRISNPYYGLNEMESYFDFYVMNEGDTYFGQTITIDGLVGYDMFYVEYLSDYNANLYIAFPYYFEGYESQSTWVYNRVAEFQDDGLPGLILLSPIYYIEDQGGYDQGKNEPIMIIFPNYVSLDTDMLVSYEGVLTPPNQQQQVLLTVDLGADLTSARAAVAPGNDAAALQKAIEDGTVEYTEFNTSGNVKIDFGNDQETGNYTAVVVAYVGDDVKAVDSVTFFYISTSSDFDQNEGWTSLGYVDYTDGYMCSCPMLFMNDPIQTYSLEIQQNDENPGLYRLVNPYGEPYPLNTEDSYNQFWNSYLNIDVSNPNKVLIKESPQTLVWTIDDGYGGTGTVGLETCWSLYDYYTTNGYSEETVIDQFGAENLFGTYADGKITFPNAFIVKQNGQNVLYSALLGNWNFYGDPDFDNGFYSANLVMDYETFESSNYTEQYLRDSNGEFYAPFEVDMASLTTTANYRENGHVMLTPHSMTSPRQAMKRNLTRISRDIMLKNKKSTKENKHLDFNLKPRN